MSAVSIPHTFRYARSSQLLDEQLSLVSADSFLPGLAQQEATDPSDQEFFSGRILRPRLIARLLRSLMNIVQSRFHIPAAMLNRILLAADPLVTCSEERLRFEAFSACCGVYARIDMLPGSVDAPIHARGCTNVDFNPPMLAALAMVRDSEKLKLTIGPSKLKVDRNETSVIEKKVPLPVRWIKGLVEVQACQSRMTCVHEVTGTEAWRFLRSLPRMKTNRRESFIVPAGKGLRLSQLDARDSVRVGGLERLKVLEELSADAKQLSIYTDQTTGASAWKLQFADCSFWLVISPEVWRGFSGEGQAISSLANKGWEKIVNVVRQELGWGAVVDEEEIHRKLAAKHAMNAEMLRGALSALGTQGLVGFDLGEGAWFHRPLPWSLDQVEKLHPRLKNARKLLEENKLRLGAGNEQEQVVLVESSGVDHRVRFDSAGGSKCTCTWYAKHGDSRGPCKHVLAAQIFIEELPDGHQ